MKSTDLLKVIKQIEPKTVPVIVAVSGFGGSGKTSLAEKLCKNLPDAAVVSIDNFILGRLNERSDEWNSFDRHRLLEQVLKPAVSGKEVKYQEYDWDKDRLGKTVNLGNIQYLIIEGISVLHPNLMPYYDYSVWIELSLKTAVENGISRDRSRGNNHDRLWTEVWGPNDEGYFKKYRPDKSASAKIDAK